MEGTGLAFPPAVRVGLGFGVDRGVVPQGVFGERRRGREGRDLKQLLEALFEGDAGKFCHKRHNIRPPSALPRRRDGDHRPLDPPGRRAGDARIDSPREPVCDTHRADGDPSRLCDRCCDGAGAGRRRDRPVVNIRIADGRLSSGAGGSDGDPDPPLGVPCGDRQKLPGHTIRALVAVTTGTVVIEGQTAMTVTDQAAGGTHLTVPAHHRVQVTAVVAGGVVTGATVEDLDATAPAPLAMAGPVRFVTATSPGSTAPSPCGTAGTPGPRRLREPPDGHKRRVRRGLHLRRARRSDPVDVGTTRISGRRRRSDRRTLARGGDAGATRQSALRRDLGQPLISWHRHTHSDHKGDGRICGKVLIRGAVVQSVAFMASSPSCPAAAGSSGFRRDGPAKPIPGARPNSPPPPCDLPTRCSGTRTLGRHEPGRI